MAFRAAGAPAAQTGGPDREMQALERSHRPTRACKGCMGAWGSAIGPRFLPPRGPSKCRARTWQESSGVTPHPLGTALGCSWLAPTRSPARAAVAASELVDYRLVVPRPARLWPAARQASQLLPQHVAAAGMRSRAAPRPGRHPVAAGSCRRRRRRSRPVQRTRTAARTTACCPWSCRGSAMVSAAAWGLPGPCDRRLPLSPEPCCAPPRARPAHGRSAAAALPLPTGSPTCSVDLVSGISPSRPGCQHDANTRCSLCDLTVRAPVRRRRLLPPAPL